MLSEEDSELSDSDKESCDSAFYEYESRRGKHFRLSQLYVEEFKRPKRSNSLERLRVKRIREPKSLRRARQGV